MSSPAIIAVHKADAPSRVAEEQRVVLGAVYMPDVIDAQGDFMTAEEIRKSMWSYMARGDNFCVDINHDGKVTSCQVVECFISRKGDPDFPVEGTWVVGVRVPDDGLWQKVKKGELNGFSMEASVHQTKMHKTPRRTLKKGIVIKGATLVAEDHQHGFRAEYDNNGKLVGGRTTVHKDADGNEHFHELKAGVVTEAANGHRHRWSSIEHRLKESA